jgi:tetratricopeptide (TPR) repeat protein
LENFGETERAEQLFRQQRDPLILARFYARQNRHDEAFASVEQLPAAARRQGVLTVLYSFDQPTTADLRRARAWFEPSPLGETSLDEAALRNLEGDYKAAISIYQSVLQRDPNNLLALNNLAFLMAFHQNQPAAALDVLAKVKPSSKTPALVETEAAIQVVAHQPKAAIEILSDAIVDGAAAYDYFILALAYDALERNWDAAEALATARKLNLRRSDLHALEKPRLEQMLKKYP